MAESRSVNGVNSDITDSDSRDGRAFPHSASSKKRVVVVGLGMVGIAFM